MANLKDVFSDIVKYTAVGGIEHVKITKEDDETKINAFMETVVVVQGKIHQDVPEIDQDLGMGNLGFLKALVSLQNYRESGTINLGKQSKKPDVIDNLVFKDQDGNTDQYRFMSGDLINKYLSKIPKFRGIKWDVTFSPSRESADAIRPPAATPPAGARPPRRRRRPTAHARVRGPAA